MYEAEVYVLSNRDCRRFLNNVWTPQRGDNQVCALGLTQDTCQVEFFIELASFTAYETLISYILTF